VRRCYSELVRLETFEDRFNYLRLGGEVGKATFGFDRYLNQMFYNSYEWRDARDQTIVRDLGCDLGVDGFEIYENILVHHMNPIEKDDILHSAEWIVDPEYLITTKLSTHTAIHYGSDPPSIPKLVVRRPGDTKLW